MEHVITGACKFNLITRWCLSRTPVCNRQRTLWNRCRILLLCVLLLCHGVQAGFIRKISGSCGVGLIITNDESCNRAGNELLPDNSWGMRRVSSSGDPPGCIYLPSASTPTGTHPEMRFNTYLASTKSCDRNYQCLCYTPCAAGTRLVRKYVAWGDVCEACSAGRYGDVERLDTSQCTACSSGRCAPVGSKSRASCSECPAGKGAAFYVMVVLIPVVVVAGAVLGYVVYKARTQASCVHPDETPDVKIAPAASTPSANAPQTVAETTPGMR